MKQAIFNYCKDCTPKGNYETVESCSFKDCPFYNVRNKNAIKGKGKIIRKQLIKQICLECKNNQSNEVSECNSIECSLYNFRK